MDINEIIERNKQCLLGKIIYIDRNPEFNICKLLDENNTVHIVELSNVNKNALSRLCIGNYVLYKYNDENCITIIYVINKNLYEGKLRIANNYLPKNYSGLTYGQLKHIFYKKNFLYITPQYYNVRRKRWTEFTYKIDVVADENKNIVTIPKYAKHVLYIRNKQRFLSNLLTQFNSFNKEEVIQYLIYKVTRNSYIFDDAIIRKIINDYNEFNDYFIIINAYRLHGPLTKDEFRTEIIEYLYKKISNKELVDQFILDNQNNFYNEYDRAVNNKIDFYEAVQNTRKNYLALLND